MAGTNFGRIWGFGRFLNAVRGKGFATPGLIQHVLTVLVFLLLGAAPAPASAFVSEPHIVPPG